MGKIVIISGPSGSGKTTVCKILKQHSNVEQSISVTTRSPRKNEKDGESYHFVSNARFKEMIKNGEFAEFAEYCGYYYGTLLSALEDAIKRGIFYILEIDVQGAMQIKEKFPDAIMIFLLPPNRLTLSQRLISRNTDTEQDLANRLKIAEKELEYKDKYDYCVVNDDLDVTVNTIRKILNLL
ncbi:MAG: guanylate kinase [Candidatus Kuenenia sp.]|nr:guanylate kinase [Candidatus Kuenenia hertensis]